MALARKTAAVTAVVAAAAELADVGLLTPANLAIAADYDQEALKATEEWVSHQVAIVEASDRARADCKQAAARLRIEAYEQKARVKWQEARKKRQDLGEDLKRRREDAVVVRTDVVYSRDWESHVREKTWVPVYADPKMNAARDTYDRLVERELAAEKEIPLARERAARELRELEKSETPSSVQLLWLSQLQIAVITARREAMIWHLQARKTALTTTANGLEAPKGH